MKQSLQRNRLLDSIKWGDWCLICLYISLGSGIIVGLQYNPATPFYSTTSLDVLVPFGSYFRSLHFYSSLFFFILTIIHYAVVFKHIDTFNHGKRISLVLTVPVILTLLFTGYVLRSDSTGASAGMIAENILLTIPLIGSTMNKLLFSISDTGMQRVYMHHVISFDVLFLILAWDHIRRYRVTISSYPLFTALVLLFSLFIAAPIDPEELGKFYITGPWFFLGLQELLRYLPPFLAGIIFPALFIVALLLLTPASRWFKPLSFFIIIWLAAYTILTILALKAHG